MKEELKVCRIVMRTKHVHQLELPQLGQEKTKLHNLPPFALHQEGLEVVLVHTDDLNLAYEDHLA